MKVVSLIVCGVLAMPVLAQERKPAPAPEDLDARAKAVLHVIPTLRGVVTHVAAGGRLVTVSVTGNPSGADIEPGYPVAIYKGSTYKGDAIVQEVGDKGKVAFCRVFNPVAGTTIEVGDKAATQFGRYAALVPAADKALLDVVKAAEKARNALDLEASLEALDEIEKAVMRARAALHDAGPNPKAPGVWRLP